MLALARDVDPFGDATRQPENKRKCDTARKCDTLERGQVLAWCAVEVSNL
jgi:hypothetical protein